MESQSAPDPYQPPAADEPIPPPMEPVAPARKSNGGVELLGGFILLLLAGLTACGDCLSPFEFAAFGFSFYGLVMAKGWPFRAAGVLLSGLSGGIVVRGLIAYWHYWTQS